MVNGRAAVCGIPAKRSNVADDSAKPGKTDIRFAENSNQT